MKIKDKDNYSPRRQRLLECEGNGSFKGFDVVTDINFIYFIKPCPIDINEKNKFAQ